MENAGVAIATPTLPGSHQLFTTSSQGRRISGFECMRAPPEHVNASPHYQKHPLKMKGKLNEASFQTDIYQIYDRFEAHRFISG